MLDKRGADAAGDTDPGGETWLVVGSRSALETGEFRAPGFQGLLLAQGPAILYVVQCRFIAERPWPSDFPFTLLKILILQGYKYKQMC